MGSVTEKDLHWCSWTSTKSRRRCRAWSAGPMQWQWISWRCHFSAKMWHLAAYWCL